MPDTWRHDKTSDTRLERLVDIGRLAIAVVLTVNLAYWILKAIGNRGINWVFVSLVALSSTISGRFLARADQVYMKMLESYKPTEPFNSHVVTALKDFFGQCLAEIFFTGLLAAAVAAGVRRFLPPGGFAGLKRSVTTYLSAKRIWLDAILSGLALAALLAAVHRAEEVLLGAFSPQPQLVNLMRIQWFDGYFPALSMWFATIHSAILFTLAAVALSLWQSFHKLSLTQLIALFAASGCLIYGKDGNATDFAIHMAAFAVSAGLVAFLFLRVGRGNFLVVFFAAYFYYAFADLAAAWRFCWPGTAAPVIALLVVAMLPVLPALPALALFVKSAARPR